MIKNENGHFGYSKYIKVGQEKIFTVVMLPDEINKFPIVIMRTPYVDYLEDYNDDDIVKEYLLEKKEWLNKGYACVVQHCRGRGKSSGDCIPYIHEREDGMALLNYIRESNFYNGELFLNGSSYTSYVLYSLAPFDSDIKGAIFAVMSTSRYNLSFRNGVFRKRIEGDWYIRMYKAKTKKIHNYSPKRFDEFPISNFSINSLGEYAEDFQLMLNASDKSDNYWNTFNGGKYEKDTMNTANIPILLLTGYYDTYIDGMFENWYKLKDEIRKKSSMIVSPYDHGDNPTKFLEFEKAKRTEYFGADYLITWFDYIRSNNTKLPFDLGKVNYYRMFDNAWASDDFSNGENEIVLTLGKENYTYKYNPLNPLELYGGIYGGLYNQKGKDEIQSMTNRADLICIDTVPFDNECFIKGKMSANLVVSSDCEDTDFYVKIAILNEYGEVDLRDDITSISYQIKDYKPNQKITLKFNFDEIAYKISKGDKLRIYVSSSNTAYYVPHSNFKGNYYYQCQTKIAKNTVILSESNLILPTLND